MRGGWGRGLVLVMVLSAARAVGLAAAANESAPVARPKLPPAKSIDNVLYYQEEARRLGREGRVEFEFNIAADGKANHVAVLLADDPVLARDARKLLGAITFDVPIYCLPPSGQNEQFPEDVSKLTITAARVPGAPVKHPVAPGADGRCAQAH